MARFSVHTNIALDYPTIWSGSIFSHENFRALFGREDFIERIVGKELIGTYNFKSVDQKIKGEEISHVVVDAYITDDYEIMFDIETLDTLFGRHLDIALRNHPTNHLAKLVVIKSNKKSPEGVLDVKDIKFVHINRIS